MTGEKDAKELFGKLENFYNSTDKKTIVDTMTREIESWHPTLQQNFMRGFTSFCEKYADNKHVDDRNKKSVQFCKMIKGINGGKVIVDVDKMCDGMRGKLSDMREKCTKIERKYKNPAVLGVCNDVRNFPADACPVIATVKDDASIPDGGFYFPFI